MLMLISGTIVVATAEVSVTDVLVAGIVGVIVVVVVGAVSGG